MGMDNAELEQGPVEPVDYRAELERIRAEQPEQLECIRAALILRENQKRNRKFLYVILAALGIIILLK
jgi:hypothetical protein